MKFILQNKKISFYILFSTFLFLLRVILFAGSYGGVEHDSGWYLGVAKNLAENGKYASYTNTVAQDGVGAFPSIHGRFSVQDKQGYVYFPAGVTAGPGYIIPEATILKIFGNGWWQYRAWPLLIFSLLILSLFVVIYLTGGFISLLIFQIWLWAVPQFYIAYAFEAYSETIAFFFLFLSFIFYYFFQKRKSFSFVILSGLFLSFSVLTKDLFLVPACAYIPLLAYELKISKGKKTLIYKLFFF